MVVLLLPFLALGAEPDLEKQVDTIVSKLRRASVEEVFAAERQLAGLGADAVPFLKTQLAKAQPPAQLALARALCSLGSPEETVKPLVALIEAGRAPELSVAAAAILAEEPARDLPATERELLRLADNAELAPEVARAVARALYFTATTEESLKKANATLRRLLVAAKDEAVRRECALALAEIDDFHPPVEDLLQAMAAEPTTAGRLARALVQNRNLKALLVKPKSREGSLNDRILDEVKSRIQLVHVEEPLPDQILVDAAAKGMFGALLRGEHPDRHSSYFDQEEWKKFREHIAGRYAGIGAVVQFMKHHDSGGTPLFTVVRPTYNGPAYKAGIRSYDRIIEVGGEPTTGKRPDEIIGLLRGKPGTEAVLAITRPGSTEKQTLKVTRADIEVPSVSSQLLPAKLGYVRLTAFSDSTAKDLSAALTALEKQGMLALVLDLRNNPGGQLQAAVEITDNFLKDNKLIVYTEGRNKRIAPREEYRTKDPTTHPDYPIAVLINGGSASASEIVAGALQDHQRAILIGQKTFGKGSVQKLFPLLATAGQSGMKITVAKYFLPSGRSIHGKGVAPDVKVSYKAPFTAKEFEHLRETGAFHRYAAAHWAKSKDTLARLAEFDNLDPAAYPEFDTWYKALAEEIGRDKARRLLRAWLRILAADGRGTEFACDPQEDNQLQRAILEVAKSIKGLDAKQIAEYRAFASQPLPKEEPDEDNGRPEGHPEE
ncbi:MAG: PDZ domain-containing protein [Planctomycetes bacterium]|nr:PDZ domain-containing protein [Planctomycetota bacterium]